MQVERYERYWMWTATGMLALFTGAIVATAVAGSAHPPSHIETVDPETLDVAGEFASPGVVTGADGRVTVVMRAEFYVFRPTVVRIPAGRPVTFRITSADVLHGFQVVGTNVNLTVAPGYMREAFRSGSIAAVVMMPFGLLFRRWDGGSTSTECVWLKRDLAICLAGHGLACLCSSTLSSAGARPSRC